MAKSRPFKVILQKEIAPDDKSWTYDVRNLPGKSSVKEAKLVKSIAVVSSPSQQHIELRFEPLPENRVTNAEPAEKLLLLSFSGFRLRLPDLDPNGKVQLAPARASADYISRLLREGITLNGIIYHFFGHSNSQLKSSSCFMYAASKEVIDSKIEAMGDFTKLTSVGKKAKRIGLLFSSAQMAIQLSPERCKDIADVKLNDYIFTDGCGLISKHLANLIVQKRPIIYRNLRYHPSVFQIRYRGYKGVLMLDPTLNGPIQVQFRDSMRKFKDAPDLSLSVVDYSKPYALGYLNDEIVLLLHSLGIGKEKLLQKQNEHLQFLEQVGSGNSRAAFQFLSSIDRTDLVEKLLMEGSGPLSPRLRSLVKQEYDKTLNKRDEQRCRILIPKSRLLFGVCDPVSPGAVSGKLKPGTCFVRITHADDGQARTIINTEVLVTRNPCLHPGDLQKFKAIDVPEWSHLVDCIVFPTCGKRPSADLMSGGDLDGDKFFVTWDADIIPRVVSHPALYPGAKEPIGFHSITGDDRADYLARYTNASLGKVKNLYLKWAQLKGPLSPECQQLNRLFSQCVDGNRIKVPSKLEDPPDPPGDPSNFVLNYLHEAAKELIQSIQEKSNTLAENTRSTLETFLTRDRIAVSEFQAFQLTLRWCHQNGADIQDFLSYFDFSRLTDEERVWLLSQLPETAELPNIILNSLNQSQIVAPSELSQFRLDHPNLHWKPVFRSHVDRMARFLSVMCRSLESFHKKLIIIQPDERLTLMVYVPQKIAKASEVRVDAAVRVFALPHSQGYDSVTYRVTPTKINYRLYSDDLVFQLYESKRGNTFIFLNQGMMKDATYRNIKSHGDRRRSQQKTFDDGINFECRASVALDKISKSIQTHVGRMNRSGILAAEIYVISNRDVRSMQMLDQWLQYIDTEEEIPLFDIVPREYTIPTLDDIDWTSESSLTATILRDGKLEALRQTDAVSAIRDVLDFLCRLNERQKLRSIFCRILEDDEAGLLSVSNVDLASCLLDFLPHAPYLSNRFLDSSTWIANEDTLKEELISTGPKILKELVLSTNLFPDVVSGAMTNLLRKLRQISVQELANVIELISLSVREAETAMNLLFECIEPETSRLVVGRLPETQLLVKSLIGIALDHIDEANSTQRQAEETVSISLSGMSDGFSVVKSILRIDSRMVSLKPGDHVRLTAASTPQNAPISKLHSMDALVVGAEPGSATFRCLHSLPAFFEECDWRLTHCGSFVTSKTMFDAVATFYGGKEICCSPYADLVGLKRQQSPDTSVELTCSPCPSLNDGQNRALEAAMRHSLTFLWGPPGTGKTHTVVEILQQLLIALPTKRFLVTAPTHNAVDNLLQRFIHADGPRHTDVKPIRVSTAVNKVSSALRKYTCDAMAGKDLNENHAGRRKAQKWIKESRLVFTTCAGAGLGLLRTESFQVVIIDEASQQTEPASLVPLVKGCQRAVLVGDHVQLRATVQKHAVAANFDVSLFERFYTGPDVPGTAKVMLDTQYRMHSEICKFSSVEFYQSKLKTGASIDNRPDILASSAFPWPVSEEQKTEDKVSTQRRMIFVQCSATEDLGHQSKSNKEQADICRKVVQLLTTSYSPPSSSIANSAPQKSTPASSTPSAKQKQKQKQKQTQDGTGNGPQESDQSTRENTKPELRTVKIAILTPYTRQLTLLSSLNATTTMTTTTPSTPPPQSSSTTITATTTTTTTISVSTSTIDSFQGHEADIVIFVTVRCNAYRSIGFLRDMRRLNVVMTRAKEGVIIIGDQATLTSTSASASAFTSTSNLPPMNLDSNGNGDSRGEENAGADADGNEDEWSKRVWTRLLSECARVELE